MFRFSNRDRLRTNGFTIRGRLLALSGFLLTLLAASNLYLRSEIIAGQAALEAGATRMNEVGVTLRTGQQTLKDIGKTLQLGDQAFQDDMQTVCGSAPGPRSRARSGR